MAEAVAARAGPPGAAARVGVVLEPPAARFSLRGGPAAADLCAGPLGFALPREACRAAEGGERAAEGGERAALWLGPDEWLVLAPDGEAAPLAAALEAALAPVPHSLVDVSHRQVAFRVEGRRAAELLNSGCPLDLDPAAFPVGACTRTVLAKCDVTLWRRGPERFRVEVNRSFADYLAGVLAEAERGLV